MLAMARLCRLAMMSRQHLLKPEECERMALVALDITQCQVLLETAEYWRNLAKVASRSGEGADNDASDASVD